MRVLFLTCHLPYPPISGGRRRELELLRRLPGDVDVTVCAVSKTPVEDRANAQHQDAPGARSVIFEARLDRSQRDVPAQVARHESSAARRWLRDLLATGDIHLVHVEGFYLLHLLPSPCPAPVLLVEQNIEYDLWHQRAALATDQLVRQRHLDEYRRTHLYELAAWLAADLRATVTAEDAKTIRRATGGLDVCVIPNGRNVTHSDDTGGLRVDLGRQAIVYVGNFAYEPNMDAATVLVRDVVPRVRWHVPDATVWFVGNDPEACLESLVRDRSGVTATGRVANIQPYLSGATVVAAPLRIGGGIKVKILEAMAAGRAIVTTSIGAQGLQEARQRGALVVADDIDRFADEVVRLLLDGEARQRIGRAAVDAARARPSWDAAADALVVAYEETVARWRTSWADGAL